MRTIPIHVDAEKLGAIHLGKQGESLACRVRFYASKWHEDYPEAEYQLFVSPPGATPYLANITEDNGVVTWELAAEDTTIPGTGSVELILTYGETKIKSVTYRTTLDKSPSSQEPGGTPQVHPTWWENAITKINEATEDAIASIPEDYTELAGEVSLLKDQIGTDAVNYFNPTNINTLAAYIAASKTITKSSVDRVAWVKIPKNWNFHFAMRKTNTDFRAAIFGEEPAIGSVAEMVVMQTTSNVAEDIAFDFATTEECYLAFKYYNTTKTEVSMDDVVASISITSAESLMDKVNGKQDADQINGTMRSAFGLYQTVPFESIAYNTNEKLLVLELESDRTFDSISISMEMENVVATDNTGAFLCFETEDGTIVYKTIPACNIKINKAYTGLHTCAFTNITFKRVYMYPFSVGYGNFTSGTFRNILFYETNGRYAEFVDLMPTVADETIQASIESGMGKIAYDNGGTAKFAVLADTHQNYDAYEYTAEASEYRQFSTLAVLGDLNASSEATLEGTKTELLKTARALSGIDLYAKPIPLRGNHDGVRGDSTYTSSMFTNAVVRPFIPDATDNGDYYYDDEANKIRFIMLNDSANAIRKGYLTETYTFLEEALDGTPTGYGVVTGSHHPLVNSEEVADGAANVVAILEKYKVTNPEKYICHIYGHMHYDSIETVNGVVYVCTTASNTVSSYLALDVFCVDKDSRTVNIVRIGDAGEDRSFSF